MGSALGVVIHKPADLHSVLLQSFHRIVDLDTAADGRRVTCTITAGDGSPIDVLNLITEPEYSELRGAPGPGRGQSG